MAIRGKQSGNHGEVIWKQKVIHRDKNTEVKGK